MKTIVAGSRGITDYDVVARAIAMAPWTITEVVSGRARGVDRLGERWATEHGVPLKVFPADWNAYGVRAGYLRNEEMGLYADALVAVWDEVSKGTHHMIHRATEIGLAVLVVSPQGKILISNSGNRKP